MRSDTFPFAVGDRFERWTVVGAPFARKEGRGGKARTFVPCRCDCGTERPVRAASLRNGESPSCGCLRKDRAFTLAERVLTTHGMRQHPLYGTWYAMMRRCYEERGEHYPRWGGRGITVTDGWHDPRVFIEWIELNLGSRPEGMTLDRKDNDGPYEPGNVQWATPKRQHENTRLRRCRETGQFKSPPA